MHIEGKIAKKKKIQEKKRRQKSLCEKEVKNASC